AVILGALLHDIGKFAQRASDNPKQQNHEHWGVEWFQKNLAEKLSPVFDEDKKQIISSAINNHHRYENYITLADHLSAGEREPIKSEREEKGDPFTDRLVSIFSRLSVSEKPKQDKYHKLIWIGEDCLRETFSIDEKKCNPREYKDLLIKFNDEIKSMNFIDYSEEQVINTIYFLLLKYTCCIPSAAYESDPDVSLFDHLKTTAAIAACLYDYHQENKSEEPDIASQTFCLIGGDISGIKSYIFEVLSQQGKVAKRLRSRSFLVQLISETTAHKILHTFNLPLCNLIMSAGGNFYALVPNLKHTAEQLEQIQKEFDEWTLGELNAELSINLATKEFSGEELADFSLVLDELKANLHLRKYQPHKSILSANGKWSLYEFVREEVIEGDERACRGCHKNPITQPNEENLCERCLTDIKVGKLLPQSKYLAFFKNTNRGFPVLKNYSFELWPEIEKDKSPYLIVALNNTSGTNKGIGFKYLATYIPAEQYRPMDFEEIANQSEGDKLLGYVKADVDNVGKILREGFNKTRPSISRYTSFGRMLETFFAGYIQNRLVTDYRDIYTVFSGGDDFFLIGPWNRTIDFAKEIRKQFSRFCGDNSDLTFSAGFILAKHYEPISFCTKEVENELEESKQKNGKDRITLFNQTVCWNELDKVLSEAQKVMGWLDKEPPLVSRGFIYNLRQYGEMSQKYDETGDTKWLKFVPLLIYDISRNLTKTEHEEVKNWTTKLSPTIDKQLEENILPYLRIIMEYVLTYTRS
ncbi:MAG: type III-A CRISPR-associated protein Cas10/Csm1, partial [Elusimicrobia bacterium CG02_land_8_20_14_3_00_37_13]